MARLLPGLNFAEIERLADMPMAVADHENGFVFGGKTNADGFGHVL